MKELSMHVYDLMENSTAANATEVRLTVRDSKKITYTLSLLKTMVKV